MILYIQRIALTLLCVSVFLTSEAVAKVDKDVTPLKIAYSDWPGWVAWEIAIKKKWFEEEKVSVEFVWYDYVASMDAYAAGQVDANHMTNGDALVTGSAGKRSIAILINDYSNGNDMLVAAPGIKSVKALKGKRIGVETGFVGHLLALTALESAGLSEKDVTFVNTPTNELPQVFKAKAVDAIAAWQPNSGNALKLVPGSKALYSSATAPGIIYDALFVSPESLAKRRKDWMKVVKVWYRVVDFMADEDNIDEALDILAKRVSLSSAEYEPLLKGTHILSLKEALKAWEKKAGLESIYGSSKNVNKFNVKYGAYKKALDYTKYLDPSLTRKYAKSLKK